MTLPVLELLDWRRQVAELYATIRADADPVAAWARWQDVRDRLFRHHPQTALDDPAAFTGLNYFPYDPALRLRPGLVPAQGAETEVDTGVDGHLRLAPFARTDGLAPLLGGELTLYWIAGYGGGVFLPFRDETSGRDTYGGGRYLLDTIKGADLGAVDGRLLLDFNFAYNPSCSYSARFVCPLSPPENRLPNPVRAGERG